MDCEKAKLNYYDYLEKPETVDSAIRSHVEQCPVCREEIERLQELLGPSEAAQKSCRPKYLQLHYQLLGQWVSCEQVRPFLPSLLMPEFGIRQQTPITAHVERCADCQAALQEIASLQLSSSALTRAGCYLTDASRSEPLKPFACAVLDKIRQRKGSDVLTRMRLNETDTERSWLSDSAVVDVESRPAKAAPRHHVSSRHAVSVWLTSGVAAAILLAVLLLLPMHKAQALDVEQLYTTIESVRNVHIQKFDGSVELESIWIADGLGACLFQQNQDVVFVNRRTGEVFQKHQGAVQLISQGGEMDLKRPWGLLPFKHISQLPASYDWEHVSDTVLDNGLEVQVYEWSWTENTANQIEIKHIWRGYLDRNSHLPYRIEWRDKIGNSPVELIMEMDIHYPSDAECLEVIDHYGFQDMLTYGDQNERFDMLPSVSNAGSTASGLFLSTWPSAKATLNFPEE